MKDNVQRKPSINSLLGYIVFLLVGLFILSGCTPSTKAMDDTKDQTLAVEKVEINKDAKPMMATMSEILEDGTIKISVEDYPKPNEEQIKSMLTELQYDVTQNEGTEQAFTNDYHDNKEIGIYVDIVTGEPLFSSLDKYDSKTGWPSFTQPLVDEVITLHEDNGIFGNRVEVRSRIGDSHLGHVFDDGPKDRGGLRYCMNGASLRFIPLADLEIEGYGYLVSLFD